MTLNSPQSGGDVNPKDIIDADQLNNRFLEVRESMHFNGSVGYGWYKFSDFVFTVTPEYVSSDTIAFDGIDLINEAGLQEGVKITFEQPTNGTYYGYITAVDYGSSITGATSVTIFTYNQVDILNESISADTLGFSRYSLPQGFPPIGDNGWRLRFRDTSNRELSGVSADTLYSPGNAQLTIPRGTWNIYAKVVCVVTGEDTYRVSMSTSSNSVSSNDYRQRSQSGGGTVNIDTNTWYFQEKFSSSTTYHLIIESQGANVTTLRFHGGDGSTLIEARPAYQ